jgi:hypothetical protein
MSTGHVRARPLGLLLALLLSCAARAADAPQPPYRDWIEAMKASPRGPFARILWFCKDGTLLPPNPDACDAHGGGAQHGEWTDRVKTMRAAGYRIANLLADLDVDAFVADSAHPEAFAQIVLEQFLIAADDGWILRQARYYRGALQEEGERRGGRRLLFKLAEHRHWLEHRYGLLRIGARFIAHGRDTDRIGRIRQLSADLAHRDPGFVKLRNKIHIQPEAADADAVSAYAQSNAAAELVAEYQTLAQTIREVYRTTATTEYLAGVAERLRGIGDLGGLLDEAGARLADAGDAAERFLLTAELLAGLRDRLMVPNGPLERIAIIDATIRVEAEHFAAATELRARLDSASRREIMGWLDAGIDALFGAGLVSGRERLALDEALDAVRIGSGRAPAAATADPRAADPAARSSPLTLATYKDTLDYLARLPGWADRALTFHFGEAMRRFTEIEPLSALFIQDQLRASALFFYAQALERLLRDANRLAGVSNELFGEQLGGGLRGLNPGLARGTLVLALEPDAGPRFDRDGIYVLRETVADLPPVAGIVTAGEGNPLSHVQLLARNLGIPNVAVDEELIERLRPNAGERVILAVSPAGSVQIRRDDGTLDAVFEREAAPPEDLIRPDLEKLDLHYRELTPLAALDATDSGRIVGPKAAKLGELKRHFPGAVADGLTIPFGEFRALLDQPMAGTPGSVFDWMVGNYRRLASLPADSAERAAQTERFRQALEAWSLGADPGDAFRARLRAAMAQAFGPDGSYGVFVRSDTNVEDLPGFTGAGLNLTVANVVGFDAIADGIRRVWASPFSARAFAWRQALMSEPEHVYPAVLLLRSMPAAKSGVMVTCDVETGALDALSIAVNEGVGGAVEGQAAESLRVDLATGRVRLLARASAPWQRVLLPEGGTALLPVSASEVVLEEQEIAQLIELARTLPQRFPPITDAEGAPAPADVEFGFLGGKLKLFQIRPFLESAQARSSSYLAALDAGMADLEAIRVGLDALPGASQ